MYKCDYFTISSFSSSYSLLSYYFLEEANAFVIGLLVKILDFSNLHSYVICNSVYTLLCFRSVEPFFSFSIILSFFLIFTEIDCGVHTCLKTCVCMYIHVAFSYLSYKFNKRF